MANEKCSGDTDGRVPVTSTRYSLNVLDLPIKSPWRSWTINSEVISSGPLILSYACFKHNLNSSKCLFVGLK